MRDTKGRFVPGSTIGSETRFTIGQTLGNQHAKGNPPNKTSFKKGEHALEKHLKWKGGIQLSTRDGAFIALGEGKRKRRALVNWEANYGPVPKGYVLYHINGDKFDDSVENLELITRGELLRRNTHRS